MSATPRESAERSEGHTFDPVPSSDYATVALPPSLDRQSLANRPKDCPKILKSRVTFALPCQPAQFATKTLAFRSARPRNALQNLLLPSGFLKRLPTHALPVKAYYVFSYWGMNISRFLPPAQSVIPSPGGVALFTLNLKQSRRLHHASGYCMTGKPA